MTKEPTNSTAKELFTMLRKNHPNDESCWIAVNEAMQVLKVFRKKVILYDFDPQNNALYHEGA